MTSHRDDSGITVIEIMIVMVILSIVSIISIQALTRSTELVGTVEDETRGLSDLRTVTERLSRDLREARGIDVGATPSQLSVWVDDDQDYVREVGETLTWTLEASTDGKHYNVKREYDGGSAGFVGSTLVSQIAFTYQDSAGTALSGVDVARASVVGVEMTYDVFQGRYAGARKNTYLIRLRNAE